MYFSSSIAERDFIYCRHQGTLNSILIISPHTSKCVHKKQDYFEEDVSQRQQDQTQQAQINLPKPKWQGPPHSWSWTIWAGVTPNSQRLQEKVFMPQTWPRTFKSRRHFVLTGLKKGINSSIIFVRKKKRMEVEKIIVKNISPGSLAIVLQGDNIYKLSEAYRKWMVLNIYI